MKQNVVKCVLTILNLILKNTYCSTDYFLRGLRIGESTFSCSGRAKWQKKTLKFFFLIKRFKIINTKNFILKLMKKEFSQTNTKIYNKIKYMIKCHFSGISATYQCKHR